MKRNKQSANSLKAGDKIAFGFSGSIDTGTVSAVVNSPAELTPMLRDYMVRRGLTIPEDENAPIGTGKNVLLFGLFYSVGCHYYHIYLDRDHEIVVFSKV